MKTADKGRTFLAARRRIAELIDLLQGSLELSRDSRLELAVLLKEAAWARFVALPALELCASRHAYIYSASAELIDWAKGQPLILKDAGKRAKMACELMPSRRIAG